MFARRRKVQVLKKVQRIPVHDKGRKTSIGETWYKMYKKICRKLRFCKK